MPSEEVEDLWLRKGKGGNPKPIYFDEAMRVWKRKLEVQK